MLLRHCTIHFHLAANSALVVYKPSPTAPTPVHPHFFNMEHCTRVDLPVSSRPSPCFFFELPRELRDPVYWYYLKEDGGYSFHHQSGTIRTSNSQPVDLALVYTCKSTAAEMRNKAHEINEVTFKTVHSDSGQIRAGYFHLLHHQLRETKRSA